MTSNRKAGDGEGDGTVEYAVPASKPGDAIGSLLVVGKDFTLTRPLHASGDVLIGRDEGAQLRLLDKSVSRRHALIRAEGGALTIEDLGSANGTWFGDTRLEPGARVPVRAGDAIDIGAVVLVVRLRQQADTGPRALVSREYMQARIESSCGRPGRPGSPFAIARIRVEPAQVDACERMLLAALRGRDVVSAFAPGEFVCVVPDISAPEAARAYQRLCTRLREQKLGFQSGLACYPFDAATAEALLAKASDGALARKLDLPIIVADDAMRRLHAIVERIAPSPIAVLLLGETGAGKEVFAERIHRLSERSAKPLLRLSCAAMPEPLLEAELFGYEKGAFTGATQRKPGLLETASGGSVFLDEVGELPASLQAKLLRVLEAGEVLPLGGRSPRPVDVRIISATNRDLEREIEAGTFRRDLFFRLNGISLVIPPLRERKSEIVPLAQAFLSRAAGRARRSPEPKLTRAAMDRLESHPWPGNVRELRNVVDRTVLLAVGPEIDAGDLALEHHAPDARAAHDVTTPPVRNADSLDLRGQRSQAERAALVEALARTNGNQKRAAELLGVARSTLVKRMERFGLPRPRKTEPEDD